MDEQIRQFTQAIGATEPTPDDDTFKLWKTVFKRSHYFRFDKKYMIVKISRSKRPFWGVGKQFIDLLNSRDDYYLVLLCSGREGWFFRKVEINANIRIKKWNLREKDNNYKINFPLPDRNSFFSPENFLKKAAVNAACI